MKRRNRVRHFISALKEKRTEGGAQIFIFSMFFMLLMLALFKMIYENERINITYSAVDDAIVSSLVSACEYNTVEYGLSNQLVIYRTVTPVEFPSDLDDNREWLEPSPPPYDALNDSEIFNPGSDAYLEESYNNFVNNLKRNLRLDDAMTATISGIEGVVTITEFSVYNVYHSYDDAGNETGWRVVKYTRTPGGLWSAYPYNTNTPVYVYNSFDKLNTMIDKTSVVAALTFDAVVTDYVSWMTPTMGADSAKKSVTYQRIVDISKN